MMEDSNYLKSWIHRLCWARVDTMPTLSHLGALQVVKTTKCGTANNDKAGIMTTPGLQCRFASMNDPRVYILGLTDTQKVLFMILLMRNRMYFSDIIVRLFTKRKNRYIGVGWVGQCLVFTYTSEPDIKIHTIHKVNMVLCPQTPCSLNTTQRHTTQW